jgi:hypothetical protein
MSLWDSETCAEVGRMAATGSGAPEDLEAQRVRERIGAPRAAAAAES